MGSIPVWETNIPHATCMSKNKIFFKYNLKKIFFEKKDGEKEGR